ncbi:hypothetical protein ACO0K3_12140 [Undibacterium sp. Rencai35W]|uniref:hypothetical protein n=1 Tax=Undibacterium sp. Rencai35W TaxID=3413046 RepID=UPI003BEFA28E
MNIFSKRFAVHKLVCFYLSMTLVAILSACGGGGGSSGTSSGGSSTQDPNGKLQISLFDQNGVVSNLIAGSSTLTAKVVVTNGSGAPVSGVVVTFASSSSIAILSPTSGTALSDSKGVAQISIKAGTGTGAGTITASAVLVGTTVISASTTFSVAAPPNATPVAINFSSAVPSDKSIVIKGAGGTGRTEVALLIFNVIDSAGVGIGNVKVNFSTISSNPVTLPVNSGITDATGKVTVTVNSGTQPTTVRAVATIDGTAISSISDTITVTTGVPVQAAMSLSLSKDWVEGINWDDERLIVSALLADSFGGAVADNTQVVFSTDVGAIAGIGGTQCLTNQDNITLLPKFPGYCSVIWRSQNPRQNGVATIVATSTNGTSSLSRSATFYVLGSYGKIYKVNAGDYEGNTTRATTGGTISMDFTSSCTNQTLWFEVVDSNDNPMPEKTKITTTNLSGTPTVVLSVPEIAHWNASLGIGQVANRGTVQSADVKPSATCDITGSNTATDIFQINLTSPKGSPASTRVSVTYKTK